MTLRWWYLRRGVPWPAVLGCCAAAGLLAGLLAQWPTAALVLLPGILACCAAAASFVFDERTVLLVAVTPRGDGWRRTARLAVALVPLGVWAAVVLLRPGDLPLHRGGWLLIGLASISLSVGCAALASRREVAAPGAMLAPVVALAAISPVVVSAFLGWESVYPIGDFPPGIGVFWLVVAAIGVSTWAVPMPSSSPQPRGRRDLTEVRPTGSIRSSPDDSPAGHSARPSSSPAGQVSGPRQCC